MPEVSPAGGSPAAGNPGQAQSPPMGVSPATGPTPNKGYEAAAIQRVGLIIKQLTDLLPMAGATSDIGKTVMKAINDLAKHVPPGSTSPAAEKNSIEQMAMRNAQQSQMMQQMRPGAQGAPGGAPAAGGPPQMPRAA